MTGTYIAILLEGRYIYSGPHFPEHAAMWIAYHRRYSTLLYVVRCRLRHGR